jgi:hypothetical protein
MTGKYTPDVTRIKEIYDDALMGLMIASMPIEIHIDKKELAGLSPVIISNNIQELDDDIIIQIHTIEYEESQAKYLANISTINKCVDSNTIIKHYELPTLLEKSYKITLRRYLCQECRKKG